MKNQVAKLKLSVIKKKKKKEFWLYTYIQVSSQNIRNKQGLKSKHIKIIIQKINENIFTNILNHISNAQMHVRGVAQIISE